MPTGTRSDGSAARHLAFSALLLVAVAATPGPASAAGDVMTGFQLAKLMCTRCHIVAWDVPGARKGPPLPQFVNRMRLDATALRAWLNEAHSEMPNFSRELSQQQIEDIAAYLDTLRVR